MAPSWHRDDSQHTMPRSTSKRTLVQATAAEKISTQPLTEGHSPGTSQNASRRFERNLPRWAWTATGGALEASDAAASFYTRVTRSTCVTVRRPAHGTTSGRRVASGHLVQSGALFTKPPRLPREDYVQGPLTSRKDESPIPKEDDSRSVSWRSSYQVSNAAAHQPPTKRNIYIYIK